MTQSFRPRLPASGPSWLPDLGSSIADLFRRIMPAPFRLKDYATADLPTASDYKQGLVYDSDDDAVKVSDGSDWLRLSEYDADVAAYGALSTTGLVARTGAGTVATRTLTAPAAGITVSNGDGVSGNPTLALANDLAALEALSGTNTIYYRSAADTWTAVTIGGNLGFSGGTLGSSLGTASTKNTGTSGNNVPLLDGANTWSGGNVFNSGGCGFNGDTWFGSVVTPVARVHVRGNRSAASWTTAGPQFHSESATHTDTSSAASATIATRVLHSYAGGTFASTNAITVTNGVTFYINNAPSAGSNTTMTNAWAFWINAGNMNLQAGDYYRGGTKVLGARGAAVADATGAGDVVAQLNTLLSRLRTHGIIAT